MNKRKRVIESETLTKSPGDFFSNLCHQFCMPYSQKINISLECKHLPTVSSCMLKKVKSGCLPNFEDQFKTFF